MVAFLGLAPGDEKPGTVSTYASPIRGVIGLLWVTSLPNSASFFGKALDGLRWSSDYLYMVGPFFPFSFVRREF